MPLSPVTESTLQASVLGAISNVLAQALTAYNNKVELSVDWIPVLQFLLFGFLVTPLNFYWQVFLESKFPAYPPPLHPKKTDDKPPPAKLSVRNTAIKFALDQTVGSAVNTLLFSVVNRSLQEAMADAPRITNPYKAISYWTRAESLDFSRVDFGTVWATALDEFWPIIQAGWKLWPFVSLFNYTVVKTVEGRNLVGSLAGLGWGVYMSLVAAN